MKKYLWISVLALSGQGLTALSMAAQDVIDGRWEGAIVVVGTELSISVTFETTDEGLAAEIDIPQQGATGLALTNVVYDPPKVHFELPAGPGLAVFDGELRGDTIAGEMTQAGVTGTFSLRRAEVQEKEPPAEVPVPYLEEEIRFQNGEIVLAGTLTLPPTGGPHPAVIMITGSGPQNRDEELLGFKPFRLIAEHLTRNGIATLRYDDRGVGGSTGSVFESTTEEFAGGCGRIRSASGKPGWSISSVRSGVIGRRRSRSYDFHSQLGTWAAGLNTTSTSRRRSPSGSPYTCFLARR